MKAHLFKIVLTVTLVFATILPLASMSLTPVTAQAQTSEVESGLGKIQGPFSGVSRFDTSDPYRFVGNIIKLMLQIGFAIAVVFVIIGGYFYMTASGNEEQASRGRRTILYALIGIVVMVMAYVLVNVAINLVSDNTI